MANDLNPPPSVGQNPVPSVAPNPASKPVPQPPVEAAKIAKIERELELTRQQIAASTAKIERALGGH